MRRREFITGLSGAVAWSYAAKAQVDRMRRLGILLLFVPPPTWTASCVVKGQMSCLFNCRPNLRWP